MRERLRNAATRVIAVLGVVTLTGGLVLAEVAASPRWRSAGRPVRPGRR